MEPTYAHRDLDLCRFRRIDFEQRQALPTEFHDALRDERAVTGYEAMTVKHALKHMLAVVVPRLKRLVAFAGRSYRLTGY